MPNNCIISSLISNLFANGEYANSDPYWNNVSLLYHMEGNDGGTVFKDSSGRNTVSASGATTRGAGAKFGNTGLYLDGAGGSIWTTTSNGWYSFGTGDYTIEAWVNPLSLAGTGQSPNSCVVFGVGGNSDGGGQWRWAFYISPTGQLIFDNAPEDGARHYTLISPAGAVVVGAWQHIAVVRKSGTVTLYVNGVKQNSTITGPVSSSTDCAGYVRIGRLFTSGTWDFRYKGYIDEVRITRGIARYLDTFTPASFPFANNA